MLKAASSVPLILIIGKYTMRWCSECNCSCSSDSSYEIHIRGRRHRKAIGELVTGIPLACSLCSCKCYSQRSLDAHIRGRRHRRKILLTPIADLRGSAHVEQAIAHTINASSPELAMDLASTEKDRHGVIINEDVFDFGVVQPNETPTKQLNIENIGTETIIILYIRFSSDTGV